MKKLPLLGLLFLYSCTDSALEPETLEFTPRVTLSKIETRNVSQEIESFGTLSFQKKVDITAAIEGTIQKTYYEEGQYVRAQDLLATLENVQLNIQRQQAQTGLDSALSSLNLVRAKLVESRMGVEARFLNLEKAQLQLSQLKRNVQKEDEALSKKKELFAVGGLTLEAMETAENAFKNAQDQEKTLEKEIRIMEIGLRDIDLLNRGYKVPDTAAQKIEALVSINTLTQQAEVEVSESQVVGARRSLESVNLLLKELQIRAPFAGIVGVRAVEVGQRVKQGDPLFSIFDSNNVFVLFSVKESQGSIIEKGQSMEVKLDAFPDQTFSGKIEIISPIVDPQSGNLSVKGIMSNPGRTLRPGMFARVNIKVSEPQPALVIHKDGVVDRIDQDAFAFQFRQGKAFKVPITILQTLPQAFVIQSSLKPGDQIIINPSPLIKEGINVEISP